MRKEETTEDTPFNMAMIYYYRLNQLMLEKDKAAIYNDVQLWYSCLRAMYRNIFFKIDKKERDALETKFKDAESMLKTKSPNKALQGQIMGMVFDRASKILDEIDSDLMVIMDKKKMIFPKIEGGGLKKLEKRYNLK